MTTLSSRAKQVFLDALERPEAERAAWIRSACAGDEALAARVAGLVAAHRGSSAILGEPGRPAALARSVLGEVGPGTRIDAYVLLEELGQGGFGEVWLAQQEAPVRRKVALKIVKLGMDTRRVIGRFEAERQVLALMEHPNIARVLDAGATPAGRPYFVMELVDGAPITRFCEKRGLALRERIELFRTVCLALQHAHQKGVIHRDIKPSNVLVGTLDGKPVPKVIDFGIAKATDHRLTEHTLVTRDGHFVGTPAYMSPEQVGAGDDVDTRSDVYALGVLLYELLTGAPPFDAERLRTADLSKLQRIIREEDPPRPSQRLAEPRDDAGRTARVASVPAELDWIAMRCLEKDRARRYPSAAALAQDLERFLRHEPVEAAPPSRTYLLRKLVRRHRATASVLAALSVSVVIALVGLAHGLVSARRSEREVRASAERTRLEHVKVLRLSAFQTLQELVERARDLWPATPERVDDYRAWLDGAHTLLSGLDAGDDEDTPGHRAQLALLRERARVVDGEDGEPRFLFETEEDRWWHARLVELIDALEAFADHATGLVDGASPEHGLGVARRLEQALEVEERTVGGADARRRWDEAIAATADDERYGGLALAPQLGLLPLGPDPETGLQEFAHVPTGAVPERGDDGALAIGGDTGLVLVLVPGGRFVMGAQRVDPNGPNHDPSAEEDELPLREVDMQPFFLSKYEMTKGQWMRFTGADPSRYAIGMDFQGVFIDERHPVEYVSWDDCVLTLGRLDLVLPTEAQWEHATRAFTTTPWFTGTAAASLAGVVNVADEAARRAGAVWSLEPGFEDGHGVHAPVGTYAPNPFGLHEVHGNVWEWVLDGYVNPYESREIAVDGQGQPFFAPERSRSRITRGGGFATPFVATRSANRNPINPEAREGALGVRPARSIRD